MSPATAIVADSPPRSDLPQTTNHSTRSEAGALGVVGVLGAPSTIGSQPPSMYHGARDVLLRLELTPTMRFTSKSELTPGDVRVHQSNRR